MLIHPMAERLRGLVLAAMADAFLDMRNQLAADDLSREDWLGLLIDREVTARDNKRLGRRLNLARLRQNAVVEDADLRTPRGLDRGLFQTLTTCGWIRDSHHVLIGGPTGVGDTAQGSARKARGMAGEGNLGLPAHWAIRPAVMGSPCSTAEHHACSPT
jgi:hypothetical protein